MFTCEREAACLLQLDLQGYQGLLTPGRFRPSKQLLCMPDVLQGRLVRRGRLGLAPCNHGEDNLGTKR